MTYTIVSKENCPACIETKKSFSSKGLDYNVIMKETMDNEEWQKYRKLALSHGQMSMPIVVDENGNLVNVAEVI